MERMKLTSFSLYSQVPNLDIEMTDGVFCLAGANGLGKTTFLTALNYALTGIVVDPDRKLPRSLEDYFHKSRDYSSEYFSGRIDESDRETATIELQFSIGNRRYTIARGLFEPSKLRHLEVTRYPATDEDKESMEVNSDAVTASDLHDEYKRLVTQDVGLKSFDQFAFLQHFVLTFDESRRLLFWHQEALEQALFLAFGRDYKDAEKAETLRKEVDRQGSIARNNKWRATQLRSEIEILTNAIDGETPPTEDEIALGREHEEIIEEVDIRRSDLDSKEAEVNEAELTVTKLSAERTSLEAQYAREFAKRVQKRSRVELHPLVRNSLSTAECGVCGSSRAHVVPHIQKSLESHTCPFCESSIQSEGNDGEAAIRLRNVDDQLEQIRRRLESAQHSYERLRDERYVITQQLSAVQVQAEEFERANAEALKRITERPANIQQRIANLNEVFKSYMSIRDEAIEERNKVRGELRQYQRDVQVRYAAAEEEFVPLFRNLAEDFLGIDLDVMLQSSDTISGGLSLAVELRGSIRHQADQLSESQRFFLDIALRMALAQYISDKESTAPMMIDTPEGSLDIAYESRAGRMFASFVRAGHDIVMTANINTSQLLIRLAEECGRTRMKLQRMTSWAELSDVQIEEEGLFSQAFDEIEKALSKGSDAI